MATHVKLNLTILIGNRFLARQRALQLEDSNRCQRFLTRNTHCTTARKWDEIGSQVNRLTHVRSRSRTWKWTHARAGDVVGSKVDEGRLAWISSSYARRGSHLHKKKIIRRKWNYANRNYTYVKLYEHCKSRMIYGGNTYIHKIVIVTLVVYAISASVFLNIFET